MRKSTIYLFVLGFAVVVVTALASAGVVVSAQNTNSSTTMAPEAAKAKSTHRRTKKKPPPVPWAGPCDNTKQEQTDLSGTYAGKVKHGDQPAMDATLTITGSSFTMTGGPEAMSGRITAVTTCGYTAVTIMMGDLTPPPVGTAPPAHQAVSMRAKKVGDSLTLTTVPGEPQMASFTTNGAPMKPKPRKRYAKAKTTGAATTTPKQ